MEPAEPDDDLERALRAALREEEPALDDATIAAYVAGTADVAGKEAMHLVLADSEALRDRVLAVGESAETLRTDAGRARFNEAHVPPMPIVAAAGVRPAWRRPAFVIGAVAATLAAVGLVGLLLYRDRVTVRALRDENSALIGSHGSDAARIQALEQSRQAQETAIAALRGQDTWPGGWIDPIVVTADKPVFRSLAPERGPRDGTDAAPFVLLSFDFPVPASIPDGDLLHVVLATNGGETIAGYDTTAVAVRGRRARGLGLETILVRRARISPGRYVLRASRARDAAPVWELPFTLSAS